MCQNSKWQNIITDTAISIMVLHFGIFKLPQFLHYEEKHCKIEYMPKPSHFAPYKDSIHMATKV